MCAYPCVSLCVCKCVSLCVCICMFVCMCMSAYGVCTCAYPCMSLCMCKCISLCLFVFVCLCIGFSTLIFTSTLPAYMSVCHMCGVPTEARERHQILWNWNCRTLSWEGGKTGRSLQFQPEEYCEPVQGRSLISVMPSPRSSEPGFILTCYKVNMPNPACERERPVGVASSIVVIAVF